MKLFCLTLLVTALISQGKTANAIPDYQPPISYSILLYSDSNNSQTWTQVNSGSCDPLVNSEGARLVKVYHGARVRCSFFTDAECKSPDTKRPAQEVEPGLRDLPDWAIGAGRCELVS